MLILPGAYASAVQVLRTRTSLHHIRVAAQKGEKLIMLHSDMLAKCRVVFALNEQVMQYVTSQKMCVFEDHSVLMVVRTEFVVLVHNYSIRQKKFA
jgi:hypothetical protein